MEIEEVIVTHKYLVIQDNDEYSVEEVEDFEILDHQYFEILPRDENQINQENILMETINKFKFIVDDINIGSIKKGDKVKLEYPFEGDPSLIEKVKPSCGCTAEVKVDADKRVITAIYDSKNDNKGGITKSITIFFKDKLTLEVTNSLGAVIDNPKKAKTRVTFRGTIKE